jgi:hypothetical protein
LHRHDAIGGRCGGELLQKPAQPARDIQIQRGLKPLQPAEQIQDEAIPTAQSLHAHRHGRALRGVQPGDLRTLAMPGSMDHQLCVIAAQTAIDAASA